MTWVLLNTFKEVLGKNRIMIGASVLKSEKKQTLKEKATIQLRTAIIQGKLKSGTRLVEHELSELLGISRLPIREAIGSLAQAGLVTVIPYKGAFVSSFSIREIKEFFVVRELLEIHAVRLLTEKQDMSLIQKLYNVVDNMDENAEGDIAGIVQYDYDFHGLLCKLSDNRVLYDTWYGLSEKIQCCIAVELRQLSFAEIRSMHRHITDVIASWNFAEAEKALKDHLAFACRLSLLHFDHPAD